MTNPQQPLAFVDVETTGLDPSQHTPWEIAVIRREDGTQTEHLWQIRPPESHLRRIADPDALRIGRYRERMAVPDGAVAARMPSGTSEEMYPLLSLRGVCKEIATALDSAILVGSNPAFDAAFLLDLLVSHPPPWHYRPIDVATLAAGWLTGAGRADEVSVPYSSRGLSRAIGVAPPGPGVAHTALGDARWARDMWDAVRAEAGPAS